jgi:quercetin dioxygenase-like cupin family protein
MKFAFFSTLLSLPLFAQALEYHIQCENDQVRVSKLKLLPGEKIGLHRDEYPRIVVGLKGGAFTHIEEDGSSKEILFPTGEAIFFEADPTGQLHRGENGTEELEIIVVELKSTP